MTITAAQVSELRKLTDCGMMDCKKTLQETDGDINKAVELLRKKGMAKAANKASRITAEGIIKIKVSDDNKQAVMVEINSETDFVARDENLQAFAAKVVDVALAHQVNDIEALSKVSIDGKKVETLRQALIAKIGENINVRRITFIKTSGMIGSYLHGSRIGVLVAISGGDAECAKDIAMHIAASKPIVISSDQVSEDVLAKERDIFRAQALESGKPEAIVEKMINGRIKKFVNEVSLLGQNFVKDLNITVGQLVESKQAVVEAFTRFELGEGIDKKTVDFAEEVKAQVASKG